MVRRTTIERARWPLGAAAVLLSPAVYADPPAEAGAHACDTVTIAAPSDLGARWMDAVTELRANVARLTAAECVPAQLTVESRAGGAIVLRIAAADGRHTERRVGRPAALVPIALGLIASIPTEPALPGTPPSDSGASLDWNDMPRAAPAVARRVEPASTTPPSPFGATFAVGLGARVAGPTGVLMGDVEARADFVVRGWIVLAAARYAPLGARLTGARIPGYAYTELAAGIGFGRRFEIGATSLDVTLTPEFVLMDEEGDVPSDGTGGSFAYFRFDAAARWLFARAGSWHVGLTLDGDVAPYSIASPPVADPRLPLLPTWSVGLRMIAAGDLL